MSRANVTGCAERAGDGHPPDSGFRRWTPFVGVAASALREPPGLGAGLKVGRVKAEPVDAVPYQVKWQGLARTGVIHRGRMYTWACGHCQEYCR